MDRKKLGRFICECGRVVFSLLEQEPLDEKKSKFIICQCKKHTGEIQGAFSRITGIFNESFLRFIEHKAEVNYNVVIAGA